MGEGEAMEGGEGREKTPSPPSPSLPPRPPRHTTSKYDFVKVRVWLGKNSDHYYVLSRFLLSRMLTVTKIPHHVAIKISLELKKLLVDNSLLDVSQSDLEANLFKLMERRGFGTEYINRYKMMTEFHHQRVPLIILVCGTACVGKSTIATQLAQRLNLPNVLQTDMVYELLRTSTEHLQNSAPLTSTPIWARDFSTPEELIVEFCRECRIVRKGLDGDLKKAMKDGKPVIIEGMHLDPSIYLMEEAGNAKDKSKESESESEKDDEADDACQSDSSHKAGECEAEDGKEISEERSSSTKAIIVPIVLRMADIDHQMLLEEWIASRSSSENTLSEEEEAALVVKLRTIQDYLCSFESQGVTVVHISATTFPQTLDWLHSYLLQSKGVLSQGKNQDPDVGKRFFFSIKVNCYRLSDIVDGLTFVDGS